MRLRALFAALAALASGLVALAAVTDSFRVVTTEGAWRLAVAERPRPLPDVTLVDQSGRAFPLSALRGRPVLVEFFYTSCPTICGLLASQFQVLADHLVERPGGREISLLSVSFDPGRDTAAELADYAVRVGADGQIWRIARVAEPDELPALLGGFGVVALPDGAAGFVHNAAIYLVEADGRLAHIYDPDQGAEALAALGG
jgi:protein SCO1/2